MNARIQINLPEDFNGGLLKQYAAQCDYCCILESNPQAEYTYPDAPDYDCLAAFQAAEVLEAPAGEAFQKVQDFYDKHRDYLFGHWGYDLKNEVEQLTSSNSANEDFPDCAFFIPEFLFVQKSGKWTALVRPGKEEELTRIVKELGRFTPPASKPRSGKITSRITKAQYIKRVLSLKHHIKIGDIYEANFCQDFFAEAQLPDPYELYCELMNNSPAPFAGFYRLNGRFLLCSSPERFLKKSGITLTSQPIKGTAPRSSDLEKDKALRKALYNDEKERAENVMIVDLVRNDLSRTAAPQSVYVKELYGIYTFPSVHQMISTVCSTLKPGTPFIQSIKSAFPPGSMTGAPKIKAMQLIEDYEAFRRGIYSGSLGYITPDGDFDFNVVIRSVVYDRPRQTLSFAVGGAITDLCDPEKEYEESLLKAQSMMNAVRRYTSR